MRHFLRALLVLLVLPLVAIADPVWVGPDCKFSADPNPPGELVEGYRFHVECTSPTVFLATNNVGLQFCNREGQVPGPCAFCGGMGVPEGQCEVWVTAYNPAGEGPPSARLPFVLATSAPGQPGGISAPSGLAIESIDPGSQ